MDVSAVTKTSGSVFVRGAKAYGSTPGKNSCQLPGICRHSWVGAGVVKASSIKSCVSAISRYRSSKKPPFCVTTDTRWNKQSGMDGIADDCGSSSAKPSNKSIGVNWGADAVSASSRTRFNKMNGPTRKSPSGGKAKPSSLGEYCCFSVAVLPGGITESGFGYGMTWPAELKIRVSSVT